MSVKESIKEYGASFKKFKSAKFSTAYIAKIAILSVLATILYAYAKFPLPSIFPQFLDMQISELPALLAGFSMGPISGCLVIIVKCLLKTAMVPSTTGFAGELTDILLGIMLVLPASIIYQHKKDKKHALIGLLVGSVCFVVVSIIVNRYISIPLYTQLFFGGNFNVLVDMLRPLYKNINEKSFYIYYLFVGVLPFNLLRCIIISGLSFVLYKRLSKILHWEGASLKTAEYNLNGQHKVCSVDETYTLATRIADQLAGGEIILLDGDLGAGKTTFTKGLAKALDIEEDVTSPTFTIMNTYESGRLTLNHLDMYRVESADELQELGIEECFDDQAVTVIEWNKFEHFDGRVINIHITTVAENERIFDVDMGE